MKNTLTGLALAFLLSLTACVPSLTPELIEALAKDTASFCGRAGLRGGAGAMPLGAGPAVPLGGWGSTEVEFCRSNFPGAKVSMVPGGAISIENGSKEP